MPTDIVGLIDLLFTLLTFAIFGRAIASWFDPGFRSSIGRFLYEVTEPVLAPIRQVVPSAGMIDLSPFIALVLIQVLRRLIVTAMV